MRWLTLAAALLLLAAPARAEKLHVLAVYNDHSAAAAHEMSWYHAAYLAPMAEMLNLDFDWVPLSEEGNHNALYQYTSGEGHFWDVPYDYDLLLLDSYDWEWGNEHFDSLGRITKAPAIPVLSFGSYGTMSCYGSVHCSTGVATPQDKGTYGTHSSGYASFTGTDYVIDLPTSGTWPCKVDSVSSWADGTIEMVVTAHVSDQTPTADTAFVWKRNVGAGITFVRAPTSAGTDWRFDGSTITMAGVLSWLADLPAADKPKLDIPIALHIDDGWQTGDTFAPSDFATATGFADSLAAREIKYTIGVNTDSCGALYNTHNAIWDNGTTITKYTPHNGNSDGTRMKGPTATEPTDIFGNIWQRDSCATDLTVADTTSIYENLKTATDTLASYVGGERIDYLVMPPNDDYTPLNVNAAGTCNISEVMDAVAMAGFAGIRFYGANAYGENGYHSTARRYGTDWGDVKLIKGINYLPASNTTALSTQDVSLAHMRVSKALFFHMIGHDDENPSNSGFGSVVIQHVYNYTDDGTGWYFAKQIDNMMQAFEHIYGEPVMRWVWSDELSPRPPTPAVWR